MTSAHGVGRRRGRNNVEDVMFTFLRRLENVFAAAAMAEGGDWESARRIAGKDTRPRPTRPRGKTPPRPRVRASL